MTALPLTGTFSQVDATHVAAVGPAAAILYARIRWRAAGGEGAWRATRRELAAETGLSEAMLRTAVALLRDQGWVSAERTSADDATLVWRPLCGASDLRMDDSAPPHMDDSAPPPARSAPTPPAESAMSSLETMEIPSPPTVPPPVDPSATADQAPVLFLAAVPDLPDYAAEFDRFWDLWPSGRKVGKPKALLAYRAARKRGATVEEVAAGLHAHLPAWAARIAAGESAFVPHPTTWLNRDGWNDPPPRQVSRRAANVFADPLLGGPDAADMERFHAMMNSDRPLALGGGAQ